MFVVIICKRILIFSFSNVSLQLFPCGIIDFLPLPPEDVLPVYPVFHPDGAMYLVPQLDIEPEVDMEVLVVVIVEDAVRLPWLEPESLEGDPRVINDTVVVNIHEIATINRSIYWHKKHGGNVDTLDIEELYRVYGCH